MVSRLASALAVLIQVADGSGLVDHPIVGDSVTYLGEWVARGEAHDFDTLVIPAKVPGDLISDLYAAGQIENPLYELNWLNSSIWSDVSWTYQTHFDAGEGQNLLVFDGVKMGATLMVNGKQIGTFTDQFLRYVFQLEDLEETGNVLEVIFPADSSINCGGRYMACTGGWDWAPYTNTFEEGIGGSAYTFTKGIWKSVFLVGVGSAAIEHFIPHVFFLGEHAVEPLVDGEHAGFQVQARVHFYAPKAVEGKVTVSGTWGKSISQHVSLPEGSSNVTVTIDAPAKDISLWWPAGVGAQPLESITAVFSPLGRGAVGTISAERKIGFRHVAVVTGNDTDPGYVERAKLEEGSDDHGMLFRVNGAAIMSKGANMIPMENLEGWMDADAHVALVQSSVDARMNMLRIWGGGIFLPDAFYDACDEMGVLVYHDMQYAQRGHAPNGTVVEEMELRHNIRRLSHHTSIAIWDGCNECRVKMGTDTGIYATFVMTVIAQEDASRAIWPSCPAIGWTKGVHKLNALPNGNVLETPDDRDHIIETHGKYQHGGGFPAVNGADDYVDFPANIPLNLTEIDVGPKFQNVYASEFGAAVMSSFESMSATLAPEHWALHSGQPADTCKGHSRDNDNWKDCDGGNVMAQRNYPCDNFLGVYFGPAAIQDLNTTGELNFKRQLWQCMIGQALEMKHNIEMRLGANTFGIIVWQYNEIWPTGGWGSIEYGNPRFPGQVIGGRWKPLQYWYRSSLYTDVMSTCGQGGLCYVRNDAPKTFNGRIVFRTTSFEDGSITVLLDQVLSMPAGPGAMQWIRSEGVSAIDGTKQVLEAIVTADSGEVISSNLIPFAIPGNMALKDAKVAVSARELDDGSIVADVKTQEVAMYVTLTTLAHGRFEDNAFLLTPPGRQVKFLPSKGVDASFKMFADSIRVEDVSAYVQSSGHFTI